LFGNDLPVEIEVGFGKGLFLLNAAAARPDVSFLGIEILRKYQLHVATRVAIRGLGNVRLACADARAMFHECVPPASVAAVHVYFPDPWWKKRHYKRRLFTADFAAGVARVLVEGGNLHIVSDVAEYFEVMCGIMAALPAFQTASPPKATEPTHDLDYLTNFERKFRKEGRPIYRAAFVKKSP
jgi:tRNA (guanine-N7-)-methyltransferase